MATSLAHQAYDRLRNRMLLGQLPVGTRLSDNDLSRSLGMSRTPIRKAILQLQKDGVVEKHPHGGFRVRQPKPEEFIRVFEERMALEPQAARLAAERITPEQLEALEDCCQQVRRIAVIFRELQLDRVDGSLARRINELDAKFHLTILQAAHSPGLMQMAARQRVFSRVFGYLQHPRRMDPVHMVSSRIYHWHMRIVRALKKRNGDLAAKLMREHMQDAIVATRNQSRVIEQIESEDDWPSHFVKQIAEMEYEYTQGKQPDTLSA